MFKRAVGSVKNWLFPACPWIAFLGLDGSGKSSVIAGLEGEIRLAGYAGLFVLHRRPQVVYGRKTAVHPGRIEHYGKPPHSPWRSAAKLAAMWLDWLSGYWVYVHGRRRQNILVIADRHSFLDLQADPLRYRYGGSPRWVRLATRFVPMPNAVFLLDAPTAVLQTRKQELTAEKADELRANYLNLVEQCNRCFVIDASRPLHQVIAEVQQIVSEIRDFQ